VTATSGARTALYDALVRPRHVALVGASDTAGKTTARPLEFLKRSGWRGVVYPVNPVRATVGGHRSWPSVQELPHRPDHVFVMTSADAAVTAVEQSAACEAPVVTVMSDGFVDTDPVGAQRRKQLRHILAGSGTRLLGPSSLGVATIGDGLMLTANAAFADQDLRAGGVFVASQSGSAIGALASRGTEMGIGFRSLVSTGNELDLSFGEICRAAVDDPQVTSFALFLENIAAADDLRDFAVAAAAHHKPVLAYKLGRSEAGARLAVSHTGALAGDDAVADALLADLGIARVDVFEALLEGQHLAGAGEWRSSGRKPRVGVLSTTGGGGAMVVDCLAMRGAELPGPSPQTISRLAAIGVHTGPAALIDLTLAGTRYDVMKGALEIALSAPEFDVVVAVPGSSARFHPDLAVKPIVQCAGADKPLAAFVVPAAPDALRLLRENGVSAFRTPEACADAIVALFGRRRPVGQRSRAVPVTGPSELLDEASSYAVLRDAGVPSAPHAVIAADDLPAQLPVPGPVAVKLLSAELAHKSDVGGVVLGVADTAGLRAAVDRIRSDVAARACGLPVERVLVQTMAKGLGEALVGLRRDDHAGAVVVLAAGGILAELYCDRSVRTAPVDLPTARGMVAEVVAFQAVSGYRNGPLGDIEALAHAVVAVSELADAPGPAILEAELNPLLILPEGQGVVAVDALVRRAVEKSS
jgi:acetate---CoA ligase (ADP-forming)